MSHRSFLRSAFVMAAFIAVSITNSADAQNTNQRTRQELLDLLDGENIIVVLPTNHETAKPVKQPQQLKELLPSRQEEFKPAQPVQQLIPQSYENVQLVSPDDVITTSEEVQQLMVAENEASNLLCNDSPSIIQLMSAQACGDSCCTDTCAPVCACPTECPTSCSTGCGSCGTCGQDCCEPDCSIIAGVEAIFYWVDGNNNGNGDIRTFDVNRNLVRRYTGAGLIDDDGGYVTPRLWLGVRRGKWGVVGRWWDLNLGDGSNNALSAFPDLDGYGNNGDFRSYAGDLEFLRYFCSGNCWGNFSFGYRHGRMATGAGTSASAFIGQDYVSGSTYGESVFNGDGITFGLEIHKCIGCGVNLFAKARGSFLWGDAEATAAVTSSVISPLATAAGAQYATAGTDQGQMSIAEIQAGVEWTHELKCYPAVAFLRFAFEYQIWDGDSDVNAFAISDSFVIPGAEIISRSSAGDQSIDLFGLAISTGFTF